MNINEAARPPASAPPVKGETRNLIGVALATCNDYTSSTIVVDIPFVK